MAIDNNRTIPLPPPQPPHTPFQKINTFQSSSHVNETFKEPSIIDHEFQTSKFFESQNNYTDQNFNSNSNLTNPPHPQTPYSPSSPSLVSDHKWFSSDRAASAVNQLPTNNNNNPREYSVKYGTTKNFANKTSPDSNNNPGHNLESFEPTKDFVNKSSPGHVVRKKLQELTTAPMYDYKEGVLYQTNYKWNGSGPTNSFDTDATRSASPYVADFKDSMDYVVTQRGDRSAAAHLGGLGDRGPTSGLQESRSRMERETGDKRGTVSRDVWTGQGKDRVIREENLKFQHRGPLSELSRVLPPDNKKKILQTLYGDERAVNRVLQEEEEIRLRPGATPSIFPKNVFGDDVFRRSSDHVTSCDEAAHSGCLQTTRENITEQSYCDEVITESGYRPKLQQTSVVLPSSNLEEKIIPSTRYTDKYYRRKVEDEDLIYKGPPSLAESTLNSFEEYLARERGNEVNSVPSILGSSSDFATRHGGVTTTRTYLDDGYYRDASTSKMALNQHSQNRPMIKEESMKRYKIIEDDLYQQQQHQQRDHQTSHFTDKKSNVSNKSKYSSQREEEIFSSSSGQDSSGPRTKGKTAVSVQYGPSPSYRVVFEKLTRKERITEREKLDRENATTQTYVPYIPQPTPPMIKEISVSTPSLVEPAVTPPPPPPIVYHEVCDEKYRELSKSLGDIALSIKELTEKMDRRPEPEPTKYATKTCIEAYEDRYPFIPDPVKHETIDMYHKAEDKPRVRYIEKPQRPQKRVLKTRKSKKVRMEEVDVADDESNIVAADAVDQYYYGGADDRDIYQDDRNTTPRQAVALEEYDQQHGHQRRSRSKSLQRYEGNQNEGAIPSQSEEIATEEPEIIEFYKKTHTHKVKKVTIKSNEAGVEQVITENVYDPPIITTKYDSNHAGMGRDNQTVEKDYVKQTLTSNDGVPVNQQIWIEGSGRFENSRPDYNNRKYDQYAYEADSGIATSIPPNNSSSSLPRRTGSRDVFAVDENYIPTNTGPDRFRNSSREYGNVEKFIYPAFRPTMEPSSTFNRTPAGYERRVDNYQRAWDELSERQSLAGDYGGTGWNAGSTSKTFKSPRSASTSVREDNYYNNKDVGGRSNRTRKGATMDMERVSQEQFKYRRPNALNDDHQEGDAYYRREGGTERQSIPITRTTYKTDFMDRGPRGGEYLIDEAGKKTFNRVTSIRRNEPRTTSSTQPLNSNAAAYRDEDLVEFNGPRRSTNQGSYREMIRYPKNYIPSEPKYYPPIRAG